MHRNSNAFRKRPSQAPLTAPPRAAGPSVSRRSSIYGRGSSSQPRQDPRPINDKGFQRECMMDLIGYLTSHGYNAPISSSKLPSGKEIKDMIEFLFRQIDPNIVLGKLEDEVPAFFKNLCYPFQISKSALYAAGSPHSWPNLLAALTWLVHLLNYRERAREIREASRSADFERNNSTSFFDYVSRSYDAYLSGDDETCAKLDASYRAEFEEEKVRLAPKLEELKKEVADLQAKFQTLNNEPAPLAVLEQKKRDLLNDAAKFETIINNFQSHKDALQKKVEEKTQELEASKVEIASITEENENLKNQIGAQQISVSGVEKMDKESQILDVNLEAITKVVKDLEEESWNNEVQCSKTLRDLESNVKTLNDSISRLRRSSAEVEAEQSFQYEIVVNPRGETLDEIFGRNVKEMIKPACGALMENIGKITREARDEMHSLQKKLYADDIALQEKREKISVKAAQNKKRTHEETEEILKSCDEELKQVHTEIMEELLAYMEHKEYIQSTLEKLEAAVAIAAGTVSDCNQGL
ncbi:hypothetical protein O6H91_17G066900 [Diphasiastrum complanatum]|uniref:Uncharacterized protein n=1 Tax=Diphasiastrum complanatum TaxID=34168 RepID=A0ACC2B7S1_DIPCM|nr:hypothetical protein O6H91_17G066900 [Diphasiastrum complanatum]